MRRFALLLLTLAAAALAGCGSGADPSLPKPAGDPATPGSPLSVGITDGRLGGAITDTDAERERALSRARPIDPRRLRRAPDVREGVAGRAQCADADLLPGTGNLAAVSDATLCLLNAERTARGLGTLTLDRRLQRAAVGHGGDMVANGYFAHEGRNGSRPADRIRAAGYLSSGGAWRIGENLAWGTGDFSTPRSIVAAWMSSAGHRANILLPAYREIGFGVIAGNPRSGDGAGATFVTEFGVVEGGTARQASRDRDSGSAKRRAAQRRAKHRARMRARRSRARIALARRLVGRVTRSTAGL